MPARAFLFPVIIRLDAVMATITINFKFIRTFLPVVLFLAFSSQEFYASDQELTKKTKSLDSYNWKVKQVVFKTIGLQKFFICAIWSHQKYRDSFSFYPPDNLETKVIEPESEPCSELYSGPEIYVKTGYLIEAELETRTFTQKLQELTKQKKLILIKKSFDEQCDKCFQAKRKAFTESRNIADIAQEEHVNPLILALCQTTIEEQSRIHKAPVLPPADSAVSIRSPQPQALSPIPEEDFAHSDSE